MKPTPELPIGSAVLAGALIAILVVVGGLVSDAIAIVSQGLALLPH